MFNGDLNWLGLRKRERRNALLGFWTLFGVIAGHSVLETARDTLFLSSLPATRLPWAYLAIAGAAALTAKLNEGTRSRRNRRLILSVTLFACASITAAFFWLTDFSKHSAPFVLYVWTGLVSTTVIVQLWLLLGDVLDVGQAKRVYSFVAAGGLLGAVAGAGLARAALVVTAPRGLLLIAAGIMAAASISPFAFGEPQTGRRRGRDVTSEADLPIRDVAKDRYAWRLLMVILAGSVCVTGTDFLFKSIVVDRVDTSELGTFFATFYTAMNVVALAFQLACAPFILHFLGVGRAMLVLPGGLVTASAVCAFAPGLAPALFLKGVDAALRHSLHRSGTEILFLPLKPNLRERLRGLAESLGHRGGQALGSLAILAGAWLGAAAEHFALGLATAASLWILSLWGLRSEYANRFRQLLREGTIETRGDIPRLDLQSLEALLIALGSEDEAEVHAALDMFEAYGRTNLISPLILYHPSRTVVLRAVEIFGNSRRADVLKMMERMLAHADPVVQAAALRASPELSRDTGRLHRLLDAPSPEVRATALVLLVANDHISTEEATERLQGMLRDDSAEVRIGLARAAGHLPAEAYHWVAEALADNGERRAQAELANALARRPDMHHLPALMSLLRFKESRHQARIALVGLGRAALEQLASALDSKELAPSVRLHLPRTISRYGSPRAAEILVRRLAVETDDRIVYKILRAVGRMRADAPHLSVDREVLLDALRSTLQRAVTLLYYRLELGRAESRYSGTPTRAGALMTELLSDLEEYAIEHAFRLLHALEPRQDFEAIYGGLRSTDSATKAAARELLEHVVERGTGDTLIALTDDVPDAERLMRTQHFCSIEASQSLLDSDIPDRDDDARLQLRAKEYAACLEAMLGDRNRPLRMLAAYHVADLERAALNRTEEGDAADWSSLKRTAHSVRSRVSLPHGPEVTDAR